MVNPIAAGAIGLSSWDWGALILYLLFVMAIGLWHARSERNTESYLLGGRSNAVAGGLPSGVAALAVKKNKKTQYVFAPFILHNVFCLCIF